jgi:hypothetical protein
MAVEPRVAGEYAPVWSTFRKGGESFSEAAFYQCGERSIIKEVLYAKGNT